MKKFILLWLIILLSMKDGANAYNLPQADLSNLSLKRQYAKIEAYLTRGFEDKIKSFPAQDKSLFEEKANNIRLIFIKIDYLAKNRQKGEIPSAVNELRASLKDLIAFLKTSQNKSDSPSVQELNSFSKDSKYWEITYYSDAFEWWKTSNWNIFSQRYFSTAKCGTPHNKMIQVWLWDRSVITKVNDRPNCTRYPDLIDLSTTSFDLLYERYKWKQKGEYIELWSVPGDYYKQYLPVWTFEDDSIELSPKIPNSYLQNETVTINWELTLPNRELTLEIIFPSWKKKTLAKYSERLFGFSFIADEVGRYEVNFSWSDKKEVIYVLDSNIFWGKKFRNQTMEKLDSVIISKEYDKKSDYAYRLNLTDNDFHILEVTQGDKKYYYSWVWDVLMDYDKLDKNAPVSIKLRAAKTLSAFSHDFHTEPVVIFTWTVKLPE
ncbi:MAG: hypothetical protein ACD_2C00171G0002 [uncultured bacterium (gcode 4)]|uniref:RlpA-like protein double-psi beta-barrel domain-containing protein n=1 Tax=uncultured bacterium (gcode 4) TaxID=1234023 RepID=K2H0V3_9BACT|nr:MAG: hypothetical protein ACD_2C00171G0002 [uncultured bacterium (gcode 4)]